MSRFGQCFGEYVREHVFRVTVNQFDRVILCVVSNEILPDIDIPRTFLGLAVVCDYYARLIVFIYGQW